MDSFIQQHPYIWGCLCFFIGTLPQWVSSVWSLCSNEPLLLWLARWFKVNITTIPPIKWWYPYLITVPVGLLMFSFLIGNYPGQKQEVQEATQQPSVTSDYEKKKLKITRHELHEYKAGRAGGVNLHFHNNDGPLRLRVHYRMILVRELQGADRHNFEEERWKEVINGKPEKGIELRIPGESDSLVTLSSPILEGADVKRLKSGKGMFYYMAEFKYTDQEGKVGTVESCGFFKSDPRLNFRCNEHND